MKETCFFFLFCFFKDNSETCIVGSARIKKNIVFIFNEVRNTLYFCIISAIFLIIAFVVGACKADGNHFFKAY